MSGWLDRLPAPLKHAVLVASGIVVTALLQYAQSSYTTWNLSPELIALIGFALPMVVQYVTRITTEFGVGSSDG